MRRVLLLQIFMECALLSSGQALRTKNVIIAGTVINSNDSTPKVVKVNFQNPLKGYGHSARLNSRNEFRMEEEMLFTQNMTVNYANMYINLYVEPGDSVHLTIDPTLLNKKNFEWVTITGDHAVISRQLNRVADYISRLPYAKWDFSLAPDKMLAAVQSDYDRYMKAVREFDAKERLDSTVLQWTQREIKYLIANYLFDYVDLDEKSEQKRAERIGLFNSAFFDIHNPDNFQSMMFPYHLSNYMYLKTREDSVVSRALKEDRLSDALYKGIAILLKEPATPSRDYMIFKFLSFFLNKKSDILNSAGKEMAGYFTDPLYYNYLTPLAHPAKRMEFPKTMITGVQYLTPDGIVKPVPESDMISYLAGKYPGKVIYIDVYATWCGPCRLEHKKAPELHKLFSGKDVVFVNLCLQSERDKWKKLVADEPIGGENYYFDDDASKLFMGVYKLSGYPSFLLVSRKGKVVTNRAPRPSEKGLAAKELSALLAEKP